jgi:hypothetical protein
MTMKKIYTKVAAGLGALACLMTMTAGLAACSSENEEPKQDDGRKLRQLTIENVALTRATLTDNGSTLGAAWEARDNEATYMNLTGFALNRKMCGYLTSSSNAGTSTFTGSVYCDAGDKLALIYPAKDESEIDYSVDLVGGKAAYTFKGANLVTSFANTPKYSNVKNDFVVWGIRKTPNGQKTGKHTGKGKFTITQVDGDWGKLKSGAGYIYLKNPSYVKINSTTAGIASAASKPSSYVVQITASALNYRQGPGINYKINGTITDRGRYTIVEEKAGWGRLKSGAGWISLAYTKRV